MQLSWRQHAPGSFRPARTLLRGGLVADGIAEVTQRADVLVDGALEPARDLSIAAFRDAVAGRLAQNVAVLASQGTIRHNVAGLGRGPLTPGQRAAARREVERALADGAVGLSSGLDYLPSRFGDVAETTAGRGSRGKDENMTARPGRRAT